MARCNRRRKFCKADHSLGDRLNRVAAESRGGERLARLLEGGKGIGRPDCLGKELPGKGTRRIGPVRISLPDQNGSARAQNAADFSRGGFHVRDVVDHEGHPGAVRRAVWERHGAGVALQHLDARAARNLGPHRRRRFDREDADAEPIAEGGGERAGPRADVDHGHPGRRAEVPSYRFTPFLEPVSGNLTNRLVRCRGLVVVADSGHVAPP